MATPFSKRRFFESVGYKPHRGQELIHGALQRSEVRTVIAACGVRFGKTKAAAHELAYEAVIARERTPINPTGEFMGWVVAPEHKLADLIFDMTGEILRTFLKGHVSINKTDGVIRCTNLGGTQSIIMRRSTDNAGGKAKLVGYAVDFMCVDEASGIVDKTIWENQLRGRLIDRKGRVLMTSTPRGVHGFFAELHRAARDDKSIYTVRLPTWVNPYIDKAEIQRERAQMTEKGFAQECGAEFVAFEGLVFNPEHVDALCQLDFEDPTPDGDYFGSIDLAMTNDSTVLTIARAARRGELPCVPRVVHVDRFHKLPVEVQINRLKATCDAYGDCPVHVDENGLGKPIVEMMRNAGMNVRPVYTTGQGPQSKRALIANAAAVVERHSILLPRRELIPVYYNELTIYEWTETPSGALGAEGPPGSHDDCVASFLLLCHWIRAGGTASGEARAHNRGMRREHRTEPKVQDRGELVVGGTADPEHPDNTEPLVWDQQAANKTRMWQHRLFPGGGRW